MANNEPQAPQTREELLQQLRHRHITASEFIQENIFIIDLLIKCFETSEQNIIDFIRGLDDELQRINEEAR
ncbi:hypothetical protein MMJ61_05640 [Enterococcus cecorum]|uniref:hypothetical protein n=1 Tax=Enterococcus cecorum TaxID=44008 RepID=UPI001FADF9E8|nr:hypothetical protein [Enterococcus cecorum]MCJ0571684.1 hypothetical protein [Enterococcus cecorum]MCJ0589879.1 hypothetical protein [Enterococcus cecorum]